MEVPVMGRNTWRVGDSVRIEMAPSWLGKLPAESQRLFLACVGKVFLIEEIESDGVLVLDVSSVGVPLLGGHRHIIMVDPTDVVGES
jgi:hypothetical protein